MPLSLKLIFLLSLIILEVLVLPSLATAVGSDGDGADRFRRKDREISYGDTTREHIMETRARRKRQLKKIILVARQKLADHAAGEITLTAEKKKDLENQMDIYQRKLDTMRDELEEWVRN
jgi:hypothetical protein